jgi:hypothetical protein
MKMLLGVLLLLLFSVTAGTAQSPPCPPTNLDVESQCQPAPAWVSKRDVIQLGPHCWAEVEYCVQWVCRGFAGLSRSRISITRFRVWDDNNGNPGAPPLCPMDNDDILNPFDATFVAEYDAYMLKLIHQLIIQGIGLHDGPPEPCDPQNTDYLTEVITTPCVTVGAWYGAVKFNNPLVPAPVWQDAIGMAVTYCNGSGGCIVKYHTCLDNGVPVTTEVGRKVMQPNTCGSLYTGYPSDGSTTFGLPVVGNAALGNPGRTVDIRNDSWGQFEPSCVPVCHE